MPNRYEQLLKTIENTSISEYKKLYNGCSTNEECNRPYILTQEFIDNQKPLDLDITKMIDDNIMELLL